jgi:uncharacterized protein YqgV (UPF0045/DUF77 family)
MENYKINAAIQVLPKVAPESVYPLIDKAIEEIQNSGIKYRVCPFETVVEGDYEEIMLLLKKISEKCLHEGADEVLLNLKIQIGRDYDIKISDKMHKYD